MMNSILLGTAGTPRSSTISGKTATRPMPAKITTANSVPERVRPRPIGHGPPVQVCELVVVTDPIPEAGLGDVHPQAGDGEGHGGEVP